MTDKVRRAYIAHLASGLRHQGYSHERSDGGFDRWLSRSARDLGDVWNPPYASDDDGDEIPAYLM